MSPLGNAPSSLVFQTNANLSQLERHVITVTGIEPASLGNEPSVLPFEPHRNDNGRFLL